MSDQLEDFFRNNQDEFQNQEPDDGHLERFAGKLRKTRGGGMRNQWVWMMLAACITALIITTVVVVNPTPQNSIAEQPATDTGWVEEGISLGEFSPEYSEVETYYEQLVAVKMVEMDRLPDGTKNHRQELLTSLEELEKQYTELKKELLVNYGDERIINSMIQNYRIRVQLLETLIKELGKPQQTDIENENPRV